TLEPCSHQGRTPPCANALIEAGIARVVFALQDPDPRVSGQGAQLLRRAGVRVDWGLLATEAAELNAGFIRRMTAGRPWVRVKLAQSLDGRTALASGASRWITGEEARRDVQRWRARSSAVLTGIGTVLADDPRLDVRETVYAGELAATGARVRQPYRIVLDSALRTPPGAHLFDAPGEVWIFTRSDDDARRKALEARGARVERVPDAEQATGVDLRWVLAFLAGAEMNEVHVEAGPTLAGALIRERLADELLLYLAPTLLGPQARALVALPELVELSSAPRFEIVETQRVGADLSVRLRLRAPAGAP
ncbi:MAG: bifunctional diaminohydroxyphosphoribosylaminopyrimidine deaminase/5-amino-6-(5-phosphoribosylamino)uracil reductase RibD, partial [Steroidobacteraceae bacterium]